MNRFPCFLALALLAAGCDTTGSQDLETTYVVESILVAGQPMPPLLLSRVGNLDDDYTFEAHAASGARVAVRATGNQLEETITYEELEDIAGVYVPIGYGRPVLPLHRYELVVEPANTTLRITAETVVPDTFSVIRLPKTTVVYQSTDRLELRISRSEYPGRDQSYFIFVTESLDPVEENLVPFARELYDDGNGEGLNELRVNGSPIVNEGNYDVNEDGSITLRYPWIAVRFFGPNVLHVNALDDNLYDFERSRTIQEGGSTFAPGEIPNPLPHIRNAHGLFGSQARISLRFTVNEQ